jgi:hypothetical protein
VCVSGNFREAWRNYGQNPRSNPCTRPENSDTVDEHADQFSTWTDVLDLCCAYVHLSFRKELSKIHVPVMQNGS